MHSAVSRTAFGCRAAWPAPRNCLHEDCRLFLLSCSPPGPARAQDVLDCRFAPGWEPTGADTQYTAENLYDYKDGGAEGYLELRLRAHDRHRLQVAAPTR